VLDVRLEVAVEYLKRAGEYLKAAQRLIDEDLHNAASVNAETAAQQLVKASLLKLGGRSPRNSCRYSSV